MQRLRPLALEDREGPHLGAAIITVGADTDTLGAAVEATMAETFRVFHTHLDHSLLPQHMLLRHRNKHDLQKQRHVR